MEYKDKDKDKDKDIDKEAYKHAEKFNQNKGISGTSITLPDGSWLYSSETINESKLLILTICKILRFTVNNLDMRFNLLKNLTRLGKI